MSNNAPKAEKSGYIIVHYNLNCGGKLGDFGLIQMDKNYRSTEFSSDLVTHIFKRISALNDWPKIETLDWLNYKDIHGFLMFKIENGKITEVCP